MKGTVVRESERFAAVGRSLDLLDSVAARIRPNDPALVEWFAGYCREHRSRLAHDLEMVRRHVEPGSRLLECGAVPLLMTCALAEVGYEVSALDIAPERFAAAVSDLGLDVEKCDIEVETVPFADETFAAVIFNELFEHLRINPIATLREMRRVLAPGGRLLLSTPNLRSFRGIRNLVFRNQGHTASAGIYAQYEKLETLGHMGHVREYTSREVEEFLARVGFRVERVVYRGGHGRGPVGIAERLAPSLRPFFSVIAVKDASGK